MLRRRTVRGRKNERGIVILLVAIVLLFVISAIAALAIDLVTFYTARSEAQLAADGAALAGARVLANSGMTSRPSDTTVGDNAVILATTIATQVGRNNQVGGRNLNPSEINVAFNRADSTFGTNPHVTVQVTRTDLPTFFARIWGRGTVTVHATATAEAYNPSGMAALGQPAVPVAPTCVKPWVLPNIDLSQLPVTPPGTALPPIFDATTGAIVSPSLLGFTDTTATFRSNCNSCGNPASVSPRAWRFYPGDPSSFPAPTQSLPACPNIVAPPPNPYQNSIAGCVQTPISCNSQVNLDNTTTPNLHLQAAQAVNCLAHADASQGDQVEGLVIATPFITSPPFQFLAGSDNPVVARTDVQVSDSLVTVPVYDTPPGLTPPGAAPPAPTNPVFIIGFVQLFLQPDGTAVPTAGGSLGHITTTVVNLVGCGATATGQPILGNGSSPVPVRLISPP